MTTATVEKMTAATKAQFESLTEGGTAAFAGFQELAKALQALATKNTEKMTASFQAIAAVKSPTEFAELQQKLIKESVESAVADSRSIAELTSSVFSVAFAPVQKQFEAFQKPFKK